MNYQVEGSQGNGNGNGHGHLCGQYTNYFNIGHNAFEFLLDFGQLSPECIEAHLHTRIITSPKCAKVLMESLRESIERYENAFEAFQGSRQIS